MSLQPYSCTLTRFQVSEKQNLLLPALQQILSLPHPPCLAIRQLLLQVGLAALEGRSNFLPPHPLLPREMWPLNWEQINQMLTCVLCEAGVCSQGWSTAASLETEGCSLLFYWRTWLPTGGARRRCAPGIPRLWGGWATCAVLAAEEILQPLGRIIHCSVRSTLYCFKTVSAVKNTLILNGIKGSC